MTSAADLPLPQKSRLVSGRDSWTTHPVPEHGVTSIRLSDGPHGLRAQGPDGDNFGVSTSLPATCFPPAVAVGASWDPAVAARIAAAIGREARALGVDIVLGPGVNIKRSPLCGRNFEYYSEDPLLTGVLGSAYVHSLQEAGVGASVKHFAANNQEADRMRVSAEVDARTLREIYLPAFERIVTEAQPATVMCSYNKINGVYASENRWLLTELLREEWGFTGAVVSDWGAVHDPAAAVAAGLDLEMPGTNGRTPPLVAAAVQSGALDRRLLDASVDRVLGLSKWQGEPTEVDLDAHHALAREVAAQCAVLLKNDGTLPLRRSQRLAVIGELARTPRFQGGGSSHVNATRIDSVLDAVRDATEAKVLFEPGYPLAGTDHADADAAALQKAAVAAAADVEVAVIVAGLGDAEESEGFDRTSLALPRDQIDLIRAVADQASRTVVVLSHGGVVTMEEWHDDVDAILDGFLLGQAGGIATADLLYGAVNPSGRLAETIPRRLADLPSTLNFPGERGQVFYGERLFVGYRATASLETPVRYPFGHGLSYTTFDVTGLTVTATGPDTADATVTVTNTGECDGGYVIQIYVDTAECGNVQRPRRELRAFEKVFLAAGESTQVTLGLDRRAFAYWDVDLDDWVVETGTYRVQIGADAHTILAEQDVTLTGDGLTRELTMWSTLQEWLDHPVIGTRLLDEVDDDKLRFIAQPKILRMVGTLPMQKIANTLGGTVPEATFERLMAETRTPS